jgi:hypothetical protein
VSDARHAKHPQFSAFRVPHTNTLPHSLTRAGEACEAAAALEGVLVLNLAPEPEILTLLVLLDRLCAMLTRLAHMGERPSGPAQTGQRARER